MNDTEETTPGCGEAPAAAVDAARGCVADVDPVPIGDPDDDDGCFEDDDEDEDDDEEDEEPLQCRP